MNQQERILIYGRLGKNPELKYTLKQEPICFLAVAEQIEGDEKPKWHNVVVWGKQAEQCSVYLKKGIPVFVRGRNQTRDYTNKEGEKKLYTEFKADSVGFTFDV